ncbi:hypothetical protein K2173_003933 [Erythroxylum novogranatense]|uniref:DEUBAD domain-containing protein n=1 Tax=Erythroxylum novogranatense TaxID=1862640 RepID=A0AAV8SJ72_9ROSI|nr:hypothetical protein K2173_003933 [Erythroxylum novogranatense]
MAADHRRKRLNGISIANCVPPEQYKTKKKKIESSKKKISAKSHISLQWDDKRSEVVARREQIGISQRDLRPFIDSSPQSHNVLADVFAVPQEIFELENLAVILSKEVWLTNLSEEERKLLTQFLPIEHNAEEVVEALLGGDNFHFGNPFLKWGASLCSGNLHPDEVIHLEKCLNVDKKGYCSEIQNYHHEMINYFQKLKEVYESSEDPEREVLQRKWRKHANESLFHNVEENLEATSESCSLATDDKACSSDNQTSAGIRSGELQERTYKEGLLGEKSKKPLVSSDAKLWGGDNLHKHNIYQADGAEYMSYVKISKKQHQLVKSMKQSGKSIQSKSLNRVLGDLDRLHVQPYEEFVKEEAKKLQEYWLKLANEDLPTAYTNWKARQFQRREITMSLKQDLKEKLKYSVEDGQKENLEILLHGQNVRGGRNLGFDLEGEEENHESMVQDQNDEIQAANYPISANEGSVSVSPQCQSLQHSSPFNGSDEPNVTDMDSEHNHVVAKSDGTSPDVSAYSGNANTADGSISQGVPISSSDGVWSAVGMPKSYYDSTANHKYGSSGRLSLPHELNGDQQSQLIDLEYNAGEENMRKDLLHRQSDDGSYASYPNNDPNGLLQSLFKGQGTLCYESEQKEIGPDFQSSKNILMEECQFNGHLQGNLNSSLPMEQSKKRHGEGYLHQNIPDAIYSDGGGYLIPRQGLLSTVNLQDWVSHHAYVPVKLQPHNHCDGMLTQNWLPGERQSRGGWNGSDGASIPGHIIGTGADQSLFSVLSQCNQLHSSSPFGPMGSSEHLMLPRNYEIGSGGSARISHSLQHTAPPVNYLNGRDPSNNLMPDEFGWTQGQQNPSLHDQMERPYLRSWNH